MGGAISMESAPFIKELVTKDLLNKFETRKVVYRKSGAKTFSKGLLAGIKFELLWLKSKRRYYHRVKGEDEKRIVMLEKRVCGWDHRPRA